MLLVPVQHGEGHLWGRSSHFQRPAVVLGAVFLVEAHRLLARVRAGAEARPMRLFHLSISYLTLLFAALAVSQLVR